MSLKDLISHGWDLSVDDFHDLQRSLAPHVVRRDGFDGVTLIAGVDVAYSERQARAVGAAVVLDADSLDVIETATSGMDLDDAYEPGAFALRELPVVLTALEMLTRQPDIIICDGQGIAHPRRCGLASHLGLLKDVPVIGCAKTPLIDEPRPPDDRRGDRAPLVHEGEELGVALRTQNGVRPVYVSVGHQVSLDTACDLVLRMSPRYRLPETTRAADQACRRALSSS